MSLLKHSISWMIRLNWSRLPMDVTNKESILAAKKIIEQKEGKLHVLVNK